MSDSTHLLPAPGQGDQRALAAGHHDHADSPDQPPARNEHGPEHGPDHEGVPADLKLPGAGLITGVVIAFVLVLAALFLVGWLPSRHEEKKARAEAAARGSAMPVVQWLHPLDSTGEKAVSLPCDVTAYQQTAIYTRTNGYLKSWKFDIGQKVQKGDLMAVIETPEVAAQLAQSKATLEQNKANVARSQADLDLAKVTLQRYTDAQKTSPGSVTQEDVDTRKSAVEDAEAALKQTQASVVQAEANVQQLQVTLDFDHVYAPFSGTVTSRNYDVGALLSPTVTDAGKEIFDLAATDKLRVFVNVPQGYANNVKKGQNAYLEVRNFPGHRFEGTVSLTAGALDPNTRTLRVQIDFDNSNGQLFAGEYGEVSLPVTPQQAVTIIRSSSLVFNAAGTEVATLDNDDKVHIRTVTLGRDLGTELQVTNGLQATDRVILNPGEQTTEGAKVTAREAPRDDDAPVAPKPPTTRAVADGSQPQRSTTE